MSNFQKNKNYDTKRQQSISKNKQTIYMNRTRKYWIKTKDTKTSLKK